MTIATRKNSGRIRGWLRQGRRGLLGLAGGIAATGAVYGLFFTVPPPAWDLCAIHSEAGPATGRLVVLELVLVLALALTVLVTECAERSSDRPQPTGIRTAARLSGSVVIVWSLFCLLALQDTGIAPFMPYIALDDFPQAETIALEAVWVATIVLGAAAVVHTLVIVAAVLRARADPAGPVRRRRALWPLLIGLLIGIAVAVPVCVQDWNNPDFCIALSR